MVSAFISNIQIKRRKQNSCDEWDSISKVMVLLHFNRFINLFNYICFHSSLIFVSGMVLKGNNTYRDL